MCALPVFEYFQFKFPDKGCYINEFSDNSRAVPDGIRVAERGIPADSQIIFYNASRRDSPRTFNIVRFNVAFQAPVRSRKNYRVDIQRNASDASDYDNIFLSRPCFS